MNTRLLIIIGVVIIFPVTLFVLGPSQETDEQFDDMILGDNPAPAELNSAEPTGVGPILFGFTVILIITLVIYKSKKPKSK